MKKIVSLSAVAALALGVAACSKEETAANTTDNAVETVVDENVTADNSALTDNASLADNSTEAANATEAENAADANSANSN